MICKIVNFIFVVILLVLTIGSCYNNACQKQNIEVDVWNLNVCDFDTINNITVECLNVNLKNNYFDTIWVYAQKDGNSLICDFEFYHIDYEKNIISSNDYYQESANAEFIPIAPNENVHFVTEYISNRKNYIKNWYIKISVNIVRGYPFESIYEIEKDISGNLEKNILYKPEYIFYIENNINITKAFVNIDSIWKRQRIK